MKTEIIKIQNPNTSLRDIKRAARVILDGGLVVFPTETVYGLGGNALISDAAKKIYSAKGRPSDNPLIIHVADPKDAEKYATISELYFKLADAFMPGPLTVIMPKREIVPSSVTGGLDTVAVRCPSHPVANALIREAGVPIAAPSANISGKPSPTDARYVIDDMMDKVDIIIDGGSCEIGLESTIVALDKNSLTLLRPGAITYDALCCVCNDVRIAPSIERALSENERPLSPGMKYRHYAPDSELILLDGDGERVLEFLISEQKERACAVICYDEELPYLNAELSICIGKRNDLEMQARRLFSALREADGLGAPTIYCHLPEKNGLGLALYNRLIRAAAHTVKKI